MKASILSLSSRQSEKEPAVIRQTGFWEFWGGVFLALLAGLALATLPLTWGGVALVGTLLVVAILAQPHRALYLLPFAVPFGSRLNLSIGGFSAGALEGILGLALAAWLARAVLRSQGGHSPAPLFLPFLLFLGAIALSLMAARAMEPALKEIVKWLEALAAYLLVARLMGTRRQVALLVASILLAGAAEAVLALAGAMLRVGPPSYAILGGRFFRAFGDFGQPNPFGGYINMVWPLAASLLLFVVTALAVRGTTKAAATNLLVAALGVVLAILLAALVLSWSRGAWLGAAARGTVIVSGWLLAALRAPARPAGHEMSGLQQRPDSVMESRLQPVATIGYDRLKPRLQTGSRRVAALIIANSMLLILVMLAGVINPPVSVQGRLESITEFFGGFDVESVEVTDDNFATVERVAHWVAAWRMWADHFWLGVGIGNYPAAYPQYRLARWEDPLGHAHNYYFNIGAEAGLVGLLAYLLFVVATAWHAVRFAIRAPDWFGRGVALGVLAVLLATAVHSLFDNLYVHGMAVHLGLLLGSVTALEAIYGAYPRASAPALDG